MRYDVICLGDANLHMRLIVSLDNLDNAAHPHVDYAGLREATRRRKMLFLIAEIVTRV